MNIASYILLGVFILLTSHLKAQTYIEPTDKDLVEEGKELSPVVLSQLGIFTEMNPRIAEIRGNSVFLEQVGDMNRVNIATQTLNSEIRVEQNGNLNNTQLNYVARTAFAELGQFGDNNVIRDFVNAPGEDISLELQQSGNDQLFERNGINELTRSIRFNQTNATPVIIINSY
ncbi:hypothetical protein ACW6QP_06720 [Salegentibacter sp. HM20]